MRRPTFDTPPQADGVALRSVTELDLPFITLAEYRTDHRDDTAVIPNDAWDSAIERVASIIGGSDCRGWIAADPSTDDPLGVIIVKLVDIDDTALPSWSVFRRLSRDILPSNGKICEVFALWVDPAVRRRGIATELKVHAEEEAVRCGMASIYTHTLASNASVLALNERLGYREIRRGPLWDQEIRVSLLKEL